jgi:hypothetical protein
MRRAISNEEKQANKIADILADLRLDLEMVGYYFGQNVSGTLYNRLLIVLERAEEEKNGTNHFGE